MRPVCFAISYSVQFFYFSFLPPFSYHIYIFLFHFLIFHIFISFILFSFSSFLFLFFLVSFFRRLLLFLLFSPLDLFPSLKSIYPNSPLPTYFSSFLHYLHYFSFFCLYIFIFIFPFSSTTSFFLNLLPSRQTSRIITVNRKTRDQHHSLLLEVNVECRSLQVDFNVSELCFTIVYKRLSLLFISRLI
jgi:hypothetical protein